MEQLDNKWVLGLYIYSILALLPALIHPLGERVNIYHVISQCNTSSLPYNAKDSCEKSQRSAERGFPPTGIVDRVG